MDAVFHILVQTLWSHEEEQNPTGCFFQTVVLEKGLLKEAIGYFEQQLAMLQQLSGNESVLDRGRAYGNLGDCYEALGDFEEAIKYYEQYLSVAQSLNRMQDQAKAYRGLGSGHR